jgi:Protein of unknown function (DUF3563)
MFNPLLPPRPPMSGLLLCPAGQASGRGLWRSLLQSEREAYFASATDLVDLERRQRAWERGSHDPSLLALEVWR